jgi:hypothetical protein
MKFYFQFEARQSMSRYREIESESGIDFYNEVGFLTVRSKSDSTDLESFNTLARSILSEGFQHQKVIYKLRKFTLLNWTPTSDIACFNANREIGPDYQEFFLNFCRHSNGLGPVAILNYSCNVCCKKIPTITYSALIYWFKYETVIIYWTIREPTNLNGL